MSHREAPRRYRNHGQAFAQTFRRVLVWTAKFLPWYVVGVLAVSVVSYLYGENLYLPYVIVALLAVGLTLIVGGTAVIYGYLALAGGIMSRTERERKRDSLSG